MLRLHNLWAHSRETKPSRASSSSPKASFHSPIKVPLIPFASLPLFWQLGNSRWPWVTVLPRTSAFRPKTKIKRNSDLTGNPLSVFHRLKSADPKQAKITPANSNLLSAQRHPIKIYLLKYKRIKPRLRQLIFKFKHRRCNSWSLNLSHLQELYLREKLEDLEVAGNKARGPLTTRLAKIEEIGPKSVI